jgi:PAS domain S-box-containing protein
LTAQTLECKRLEAALQAEIAERERVEAALRKSELRFQRLADTGLIGIFTTNSQMTVLEANAAFLGMVGYSRDELISRKIRWDRLTPPELLDRDMRVKADGRGTGVVLPYEKELVHKDGRRIPVLIGGAHLDSTADEAICIVLDLSGQKRAEEVKKAQAIAEAEIAERQRVEAELVKSKRRFKRLADAGILGIVSADLDRNIVDVNEAFVTMLGYSREEFCRLGGRRLTPPEYWERDDRACEQLERTGVLHGYEKEYFHKDGSRVPVLIGTAVLDEPGQGREAISCVLDLREHKRTETALRRSESRFHRLAESGVIGIITAGYDGTIVEANAAFLEMLGYSREDVASGSLRWDRLTPPEFWEQDARVTAACRDTRVAPVYEKEYFHKDGSRVPVLIGGAQIDDDPDEGVCFVLDLSDRKRVEAERKRAELELRKSERRFQRLAESGIIGIITGDLKGNILDVNGAFLDMLGYSREDYTSGQIRWDQITPQELRAQDALMVERCQSTGVIPVYEKEYLHKDGHRVPVLIGGAQIEDAAQGTCFVLDLTGFKRIEAALHQSEARFERLGASGIIGIFTAGTQGDILDANDAFLNLLGFSRDDLASGQMRWDDLTPREYRELDASVIKLSRASSTRSHPAYEKEFIHKDGRRISVLIGSALTDDAGSEGICFVLDLTDRKRAEQLRGAHAVAEAETAERLRVETALRHSESRFQRLVESGIFGVVTGNYEGTILDANASFAEMIGYSREELASGQLSWRDFTPPEYWEQGALVAEQCRRTGVIPVYEQEFVHKDGHRIPVLMGGALRDGTGDEGICFVLDLSDRKRAEELRAAHAIAEASSRAKSEFLSLVSHELRTPLNSILGFTQLLLQDRKTPLPERQRERAQHVLKGGEHLLRLIEDILDLSRIESGGMSMSIEPTSAYDAMEELMPTLEPLAAQSDITITLEPAPEKLPLVAADRTRLNQIVMNFATNAIKYNRPGGKVGLHLSVVDANHVRLAVSDTGCGIPKDKQDKLFQAFQRAGQEAGVIEGTGVGLFVAKRLVQLMHGEVGFRSVLGEGSEFWVDIPIASPDDRSRLPDRPLQSKVASVNARRILYVEDNPANLVLMQDLVSNFFEDVALLTATTGELGLEIARAHRLDVILMDINLPGMSGLEALYELRNDPKTQHVPVIAISAAVSERDKQRGVRAGFVAYLTKPLVVEEFVSVIRRQFASRPVTE